MKVTGVIAEYNPFHNGHRYQLEQIRSRLAPDYIIVIMNGDFTQRGEAAMINKYDRTRMALVQGADLVIELPVFYGTGSAEFFAEGAIRILHALGCIDHICFGSEYENLCHLSDIASIYAHETPDFKDSLNEALHQGISYPKARTRALLNYADQHPVDLPTDIDKYLAMPNTVLAIEYLKAMKRCHSEMKPYLIRRIGQDYSSVGMPSDPQEEYASASAIRDEYRMNGFRGLTHALPHSSLQILTEAYHRSAPMTMEFFYPLIQYRILQMDHPLTDYLDITEDLANRMLSVYTPELTYQEYVDAICSKQYTRTRITRSLLHILLGITQCKADTLKHRSDHLYARVLGFRKDASELLRHIRKSGSIPIIQRPKEAFEHTLRSNPTAANLLQMDIQAAHLYEQVCCQTFRTQVHNEYTQGILII